MTDWFYKSDDHQVGPVSTAVLKQLAADGQLQPADTVWREGLEAWVLASKIKGLFPEAVPRVSDLDMIAAAAATAAPARAKIQPPRRPHRFLKRLVLYIPIIAVAFALADHFVLGPRFDYISKTVRDAARESDGESLAGAQAGGSIDPAASFKIVVDRLLPQLNSRFSRPIERFDNFRMSVSFPEQITFDVRKTDSLLNPIVGTVWMNGLTIEYGDSSSTPDKTNLNCTLTAVFQEGRWKFREVESNWPGPLPTDMLSIEGTDEPDMTMRDSVAPKIKASFDAALETLSWDTQQEAPQVINSDSPNGIDGTLNNVSDAPKDHPSQQVMKPTADANASNAAVEPHSASATVPSTTLPTDVATASHSADTASPATQPSSTSGQEAVATGPDIAASLIGDWQGKGLLMSVRQDASGVTLTQPSKGYHSIRVEIVNGSALFFWSNLDEIMVVNQTSSNAITLTCYSPSAASDLEAGQLPLPAHKWQHKLKRVVASDASSGSELPAPSPHAEAAEDQGTPEQAAGQLNTDPSASYKAFAKAFLKSLDDAAAVSFFNGYMNRQQKNAYKVAGTDYSIDLKRTDSILSPYLGTLDVDLCCLIDGSASGVHSYRFTFAEQDGKWTLKSVEDRMLGDKWVPVSDDWAQRLFSEATDATNQQ